MKIAIFYDTGVKERHFRDGFKELMKEHQIRIVELDRSISFTASTESEKRIREFIGSPRQIVSDIGDADILVVNYAPVTAEVMDADKSLKLVGVTRGGPVNVDVQAASMRGIPVVNAPERNVESVADFTIGLIISSIRQIARSYHSLKIGREFRVNPRLYPDAVTFGFELNGKTLGIVGLGRIGRRVAERASAFGMRIIYYDPYVPAAEGGKVSAKRVDLNNLLSESDVVTLHLRLSRKTRHMIGKEQLDLMKEDAYIVNTSRGGIIDEKALIQTLREDRILGAALDVVEDEPIRLDNPLLKLDNVVITPHVAGSTVDVPFKSVRIMAEEVTKFVRGGKLTRLVSSKP